MAGSFTTPTSASVVWLTEMGLDITMQRLQAYRIGADGVIVTISQLFPVPDVEEFTISPQRAEAAATQTRRRKTRERSAVHKLVSSSALADGTQLFLRTTTEIDAEARTLVDSWVDEDPRRGRASWQNDKAKPLTWEYDGGSYRPTSIVSQILQGAPTLIALFVARHGG